MPIYEYACRSCGEIFEEFQPMSSRPLEKCKRCGSPSVKRIVSSTSFILKGSGWYATDYSGKKPAGKSGDKKEDGGKKSDGGKKEDGGKGGSPHESKDKTSGEPKPSKPGESHAHT